MHAIYHHNDHPQAYFHRILATIQPLLSLLHETMEHPDAWN